MLRSTTKKQRCYSQAAYFCLWTTKILYVVGEDAVKHVVRILSSMDCLCSACLLCTLYVLCSLCGIVSVYSEPFTNSVSAVPHPLYFVSPACTDAVHMYSSYSAVSTLPLCALYPLLSLFQLSKVFILCLRLPLPLGGWRYRQGLRWQAVSLRSHSTKVRDTSRCPSQIGTSWA